MAQRIHEKGGGTLRKAMLATALSNSPTSSSFVRKAFWLKQHGLADEADGDALQLTRLGLSVVAPTPEDNGLSLRQAFLNVPVFEYLHQRYADKPLPAASDLANLLIQEKGFEREFALEWAQRFHQGAADAKLIHQGGGKTILLDKSEAAPAGTFGSERSKNNAPTPPPPPEDNKGYGYVLQLPYGEVRLAKELKVQDLDILIGILEKMKEKLATS